MESHLEQDIILEDNVAYLRTLNSDDIENLIEFAENEPELYKYSSIPTTGRDNLTNYIDQALQKKDAKTEYPFIIFDKRTNEYAGTTRFYDIQPNQKTLQLGYTWYGGRFHGTGLNKHCKFLLLQYAFEALQVERVEFRADNENVRSIAAMKSIGCTVEGVMRNHIFRHDGTRRDTIVLSILRNEWFSSVKENLLRKITN